MRKLKVGDAVRVKCAHLPDIKRAELYVGRHGMVTNIESAGQQFPYVGVTFGTPDDADDDTYFWPEELELT